MNFHEMLEKAAQQAPPAVPWHQAANWGQMATTQRAQNIRGGGGGLGQALYGGGRTGAASPYGQAIATGQRVAGQQAGRQFAAQGGPTGQPGAGGTFRGNPTFMKGTAPAVAGGKFRGGPSASTLMAVQGGGSAAPAGQLGGTLGRMFGGIGRGISQVANRVRAQSAVASAGPGGVASSASPPAQGGGSTAQDIQTYARRQMGGQAAPAAKAPAQGGGGSARAGQMSQMLGGSSSRGTASGGLNNPAQAVAQKNKQRQQGPMPKVGAANMTPGDITLVKTAVLSFIDEMEKRAQTPDENMPELKPASPKAVRKGTAAAQKVIGGLKPPRPMPTPSV